MFSKLIKLITIVSTLILVICLAYLGKLYHETTPVFKKLRVEIEKSHEATKAENFIKNILFGETNKAQARPADFVARNALRTHSQKMFDYHGKNIILAKRLKHTFGNDQILSFWLSSVYLGGGEYGLDVAAMSLFDKPPNALSPDELIALAALVKQPQLRHEPVKWETIQTKMKDGLTTKIRAR